MLPPTAQAARFADEQFTLGRTLLKDREFIYLFNWSDAPAERAVKLSRPARLLDYWTGEDLGIHTNEFQHPGPGAAHGATHRSPNRGKRARFVKRSPTL